MQRCNTRFHRMITKDLKRKNVIINYWPQMYENAIKIKNFVILLIKNIMNRDKRVLKLQLSMNSFHKVMVHFGRTKCDLFPIYSNNVYYNNTFVSTQNL